MEYQNMPQVPYLIEAGDLRGAKNLTDSKISIVKVLPELIGNLTALETLDLVLPDEKNISL